MAFIEEHPDYRSYNYSQEYCYHEVPQSVWQPFESLVLEASGEEGESFSQIINKISTRVRCGILDSSLGPIIIPDVVSALRAKVKKDRYELFMDCLLILYTDGQLTLESINEFLEEHLIGYRLICVHPSMSTKWEVITSCDEPEEDTKIPSNLIYKLDSMKIVKGEREMVKGNKTPKLFITHSSNDKKYVEIIAELLRKLRVPTESIICTSDDIHIVPNGENAFDWLKSQFINHELHMIFVLSENYFNSTACLNEMGAAWIVAHKSDVLLLPGFKIEHWKLKGGCLSTDIQAGCMEHDEKKIKAWLNNLKNEVILEFGLPKPNELEWEDNRDDFIKKMKSVKRNIEE